MIKYDESYRTAILPDVTSVNPSEKNRKEYYLSVLKGLYGVYVRGGAELSYGNHTSISENRAYGKGEHDTTEMMSFLSGQSQRHPKEGEFSMFSQSKDSALVELSKKAWANVDWRPISPLPKIKAVNSRLADIDYEVTADAIDPLSRDREMDRKAYAMFYSEFQDVIRKYCDNAGIPVDEPEYIPESPEEFEVYCQEGGFKDAGAMMLEVLMEYSFEYGDYKEILSQHKEDLQDCGYIAIKIVKDPNSGRVFPRYADIGGFFIQASKYNDFRDAEYAGEFGNSTVSRMISLGASEEDVKSAVNYYSGWKGNMTLSEPFKDMGELTEQHRNMKVCTMEASWIDCDVERRATFTNRFGEKRIVPQVGSEWKKVYDLPNKRTYDIRTRVARTGTWYVGTDFISGCEPISNQPRENCYDVLLNYRCYRLPYKSLVETCKPFVRGLNVAWFKLQNALLVAANSGHAVNVSMLQNLKSGENEKISWVQALQVFRGLGLLPFMQSFSGKYEGGAVNPMVPIQGGIGTALEENIRLMDINMQHIYTFTGMNPLQLAEGGDPNMPVRTSQMMMEATNDVLKPYVRASYKIKQDAARVLNAMVATAQHDEGYMKRAYGGILGEAGVRILKEAKMKASEYGLRLRVRPTDLEKRAMIEASSLAMQAEFIDPDVNQYMIEKVAEGANFKRLRMYLGYKIRKAKEQKRADSTAIIREQSAGNERLEMMKQQIMQMEFGLKGQIEMRVQEAKSNALRMQETERRITMLMKKIAEGEGRREQLLKEARDERNDEREAGLRTAETPPPGGVEERMAAAV